MLLRDTPVRILKANLSNSSKSRPVSRFNFLFPSLPPLPPSEDGDLQTNKYIYAWPYQTQIPSSFPSLILLGVQVFHAGTTEKDGKIVTSGGRVLVVSSVAPSVKEAVDLAYQGVSKIKFEGATYRKDIAYRYVSIIISLFDISNYLYYWVHSSLLCLILNMERVFFNIKYNTFYRSIKRRKKKSYFVPISFIIHINFFYLFSHF